MKIVVPESERLLSVGTSYSQILRVRFAVRLQSTSLRVQSVAAIYSDSSLTIKHVQAIAGPYRVNNQTSKQVFIAFKVLTTSDQRYWLTTFLTLRRPVLGVYVGPITDSIFVTPHQFVNDIHKSLVFFEKGSLAHIETASDLASIRDADVPLEKLPYERA